MDRDPEGAPTIALTAVTDAPVLASEIAMPPVGTVTVAQNPDDLAPAFGVGRQGDYRGDRDDASAFAPLR